MLEIAVVLLGASLSTQTPQAAGVGLLLGIVAVVAMAISISYGIERMSPSRDLLMRRHQQRHVTAAMRMFMA
jgi:uncharacterized membrane protein YadS